MEVTKIHNDGELQYITVDDYLLTSNYSSEDEKRRFLEQINYKHRSTTYIIFGLGLGSYIDELNCKLHHSNVIVVVEPNQEIFEYYKYSDHVISNKRIYYVCALPNEVIAFLNANNINSRFKVVYGFMNYRNIYQIQFKELAECVRNDSVVKLGNSATIKKYDREFTLNMFKNYFFNEFDLPINSLKNKYKDVPALIVSAGPSLEKQLELINQFQGLVFSGGRTIREFSKRNIRVDFMVSVDPTDKVYELVEGADKMGTMPPLFTYLISNHNVVEHHNSKKILMNSPSAPIIFDSEEQLDVILTGPSVANVSVSIAKYLGCNPIVLIGQDLSYTDGKHHADFTAMKFDKTNISGDSTLEVDGYYGDKIKTTRSFYGMLNWFENWIEHSSGTYINATEGGVCIHGCKQMSFGEYLDEQVALPMDSFRNIINDLCGNGSSYKSKMDVVAHYDRTQKLVSVVKKMVFHSQKIVESIRTSNKININRNLAELAKLEEYIKKEMKDYHFLNFLFASAGLDFENRKRRMSQNDDLTSANSNLAFYRNLSDNLQYLLSWLKESLDARDN